MIVSFKDRRTARLAANELTKGFPAELVVRARAALLLLDSAKALHDLRFPPGNQLEPLRGDRKGQHSIRINKQWRLCFIWSDEGPTDVEFVDYH